MNWPLMRNNITEDDRQALIEFVNYRDMSDPLGQTVPRMTQGFNVREFEREFAQWLGVKYAVFVNSGASANLITMAALRELKGVGEVIVPPLTWVSDVAAIIHAGMTPVFADIDPRTLGLDWEKVQQKTTKYTKAVFLTHCLGFNGLTINARNRLARWKVPLIEDCCEALGAYYEGRKLGTFGLASNFSFYYAHHMSTIEGGMVCTDDEGWRDTMLMLRSHGMVRELYEEHRESASAQFPDLHPEFIFWTAGYNVRSTELNAVIGRNQLKRVDEGNSLRSTNLYQWLDSLDASKYRTEYARFGSSNYALPLILNVADAPLMERVLALLKAEGVEYRRGTAGGGNQLRQPYLRGFKWDKDEFREVEHVHFYGLYLGNYPSLDPAMIAALAKKLNAL